MIVQQPKDLLLHESKDSSVRINVLRQKLIGSAGITKTILLSTAQNCTWMFGAVNFIPAEKLLDSCTPMSLWQIKWILHLSDYFCWKWVQKQAALSLHPGNMQCFLCSDWTMLEVKIWKLPVLGVDRWNPSSCSEVWLNHTGALTSWRGQLTGLIERH